jgi:hypothetical protein
MGKYDSVLNKLQKFEAPHDVRVAEAMDKMRNVETVGLARLYKEARLRKKELEEIIKGINVEIEAQTRLMEVRFESEGVTSLKLSDGGTVSIQPEVYPQVKDKEKFRLWCIDNGLEQSLSLPWQTTAAITKQLLLDGNPEPDGVECYNKVKAKYRKG